MARDESSSLGVLSFDKRAQQLNSKLAMLNREFAQFICTELEKDPEIDLSPTVKSYLGNVKDLRIMYGFGVEEKKEGGEIVRKKLKARRMVKGGDGEMGSKGSTMKMTTNADVTIKIPPKTPQLKMSTPAGPSAPASLDMSADISAISPFGGFGGSKKIEKDETLKALPPTIGAPSAGAGGRKRAIRGGGPLGGGESVHFRGNETAEIASPSIVVKPPPIEFNLPKGNASFWNKSKDDGKKEEKGGEEKGSPFTLGTSAAPKFTGFNFGGSGASSSSSSTPSTETTKPAAGGFNLFGSIKAPDSSTTSSSTTPKLTFGLPAPTGGMPLSFPSFAPAKTDAAAAAAAPAAAGGDEEEGEYVPPKVEVVENKEEDAKISAKCGVHKLEGAEYVKLGVGQLYVKETDGKMSLLIRAATTTGSIWVNALVDKTMKAEKAAEDKIRVTVPISSKEIKTFVVRVGQKEDAAKILAMLKDGGAN